TVYLPEARLPEFLLFMRRFHAQRQDGILPRVAGIAVEGPLLASVGGTPESGVWRPTKADWSALASCAESGLRYVVLSPDADLPSSLLTAATFNDAPTVDWACRTLASSGVIPALGHFTRGDPRASAEC